MIGTTTVGKLAKKWGMERGTLRRRLLRMHRDRPGAWMVRLGNHWAVNVTLLRKVHPELFGLPDPRDFSLRLLSLESAVKQVRGRVAILERVEQSGAFGGTDA